MKYAVKVYMSQYLKVGERVPFAQLGWDNLGQMAFA